LGCWDKVTVVLGQNEDFSARDKKPRIQPLLAGIANLVIMSALGVSVTYAVAIRAG
jgi:hypothetical protein